MSRIAVFADVQNIYYTTRQAFGRQFNYRALWEQLCNQGCLLYTSPSPRDLSTSRMPSSA